MSTTGSKYTKKICKNCRSGETELGYGVNLCRLMHALNIADEPESIFRATVTQNVTDIVLRKGQYELCFVSINKKMLKQEIRLHRSQDDKSPRRVELARTHFVRVNYEELLKKLKSRI